MEYNWSSTPLDCLISDRRVQTVVLVDSSWLLYRSYYAYQGIQPTAFIEDREVYAGDIFGYTTTIMDLRKLLSKAPIFLCLDGKHGSSSLREVCPSYKANRKKKPEVFEKYEDILRATALIPGVFILVDDRFEADEVICKVAETWHAAGIRVIIFGSDKDLNQVISGRDVVRASLIRNNQFDDFYTEESFHADYGSMAPSSFPLYQAMVGDKRTDNYGGYFRFPKRVAAKLAAEYATPEALLKAVPEGQEARWIRMVQEDPGLLTRNYYVAKARDVGQVQVYKATGDPGIVRLYRLRRFWQFLQDQGVVKEPWFEEDQELDLRVASADLSFSDVLDD